MRTAKPDNASQTFQDVLPYFLHAKEFATLAGIPHSQDWELVHDAELVCPWRIVDTGANAPGAAVVFRLKTGNPSRELETIGTAFRASYELKRFSKTTAFVCTARL